jgi:hypothetical protein
MWGMLAGLLGNMLGGGKDKNADANAAMGNLKGDMSQFMQPTQDPQMPNLGGMDQQDDMFNKSPATMQAMMDIYKKMQGGQ